MIEIVISSIGCAAGAFLALAILARDRTRSPQSAYLAIASALLAATMGEDALAAGNAYDGAPWAFGWSYPAFAFIGPLIWLHVAAHVDPIGAGWPRARKHLAGATLLLLLLLPWWAAGGGRWAIEQSTAQDTPSVLLAAFSLVGYIGLSALQMLVYLVAARNRANAVVEAHSRVWLKRLITVGIVSWIVYAVGLVALVAGVDSAIAVTATNTHLAVAIYGLAITAIAVPPDPLSRPPERDQTAANAKYARSALTEADIDRLMGKLALAVRDQAIHQDANLTLQKLAAAIGASPNDLSQALNLRADGFHAWLSSVRVAEVQSLLRDGAEVSGLLDAAYAAGFNSKSTFYEAFRRTTGLTPAAWRARLSQGGAAVGGATEADYSQPPPAPGMKDEART